MNNLSQFYEGKFIHTDRWSRKTALLSFFYQKLTRQRLFYRYLPSGKLNIVDLGCGGGNELFASKGNVTGIDISKKSLLQASHIYKKTIQGSIGSIPAKDSSYDVAISADLIGHIPLKEKQVSINEIFRILKKNGLTLHYIEIDSNNPENQFAKKYINLYKKYFINQDGHHGLESIDTNVKYFINAGFKIKKIIPLYKLTFDTDEYLKRFDNEYLNQNKLIKIKVFLAKITNLNKILKLTINLLGGLLYDFVSLFLPVKYAGGLFIVAIKPSPHSTVISQ